MDSKYGRIYTQDDVKRLVTEAYEQGARYGMSGFNETWTQRFLTAQNCHFPADEPIFVLRAQDKLAPDVVDYWSTRAAGRDVDQSAVDSASKCADEMDEWQENNPDKVKLPD